MYNISKRQEEIIHMAGQIISENGISDLTTKKLAKAMQFSEPALYRHFKNKEAIIISMLRYLAENMELRLQKIEGSSVTASQKLTLVFEKQFDFFSENSYFVTVVFSDALWEQSTAVNQCLENLMKIKRSYLQSILREGQMQGEFIQQIPEEHLLMMVLGAFRHHMFSWKLGGFQTDLKGDGEKLLHSLLFLISMKHR